MTYAIESPGIVNADATPQVINTTGEEGSGMLRNASDYVPLTTAQLGSTATVAAVVRLPSNAKIKDIKLETGAALDSNGTPLLTFDVGAAYSDSTHDGTPSASRGVLIDADAFGAAVVFGRASYLQVDGDSAFAAMGRIQPLWQALGLTADPRSPIDIVLTVHAAAATAVAGNVHVSANYVV